MDKQLDLFGFEVPDDIGVGELQKQRTETYTKDWCFQYDMRQRNLKEDLFYAGITEDEALSLTVDDFEFDAVLSESGRKSCTKFIERHEWLGTIPPYTTHYFSAKWRNILCGVVLMSEPNAQSKILGDDTWKVERLISRGACISFSPKNLGSAFVMWCIKWMVQNTQYRLFTAYSDPSAKELGTIYQALNFYYLGNNFGSTKRYINPYTGTICNDRTFRHNNMYKLYANELGLKWDDSWIVDNCIDWSRVPDEIEEAVRNRSREVVRNAKTLDFPSKHKYAFVLGRDKRETKYLRKRLENLNKIYPYPKERGK